MQGATFRCNTRDSIKDNVYSIATTGGEVLPFQAAIWAPDRPPTDAPHTGNAPPEQVTLRSLLAKLYNLVLHSRWDRAFRTIS